MLCTLNHSDKRCLKAKNSDMRDNVLVRASPNNQAADGETSTFQNRLVKG